MLLAAQAFFFHCRPMCRTCILPVCFLEIQPEETDSNRERSRALIKPHDTRVAVRPATGSAHPRLLRDFFFFFKEPSFQNKQQPCKYFFSYFFSLSVCTMGCAISGLGTKAEFGERRTEDAASAAAAAAAVYPRDDQIQMIKESWKVIRDDIAKVGIIMFVR